MNKRRTPFTVEHAITQVIGLLGQDGFEEATGKSWSLGTKWSDPDNPARPSPEQIILLEIAYRQHGGRGSPILEAMQWRVDRGAQETRHEHEDVRDEMIDVHAASGHLADAVRKAVKAGSTAAEDWRDILNRGVAMRAEVDDVIRHAEDALVIAKAGRAA